VLVEDHADISDTEIAFLSRQRSLFVYTHELPAFAAHVWPRLSGSGYILVTHNSDDEVGQPWLSWIEDAGDKLRHWFAQNVLVQHPKLVPLPIGIANSMWAHGNLKLLQRAMSALPRVDKTELVYLQFNSQTHPDRPRASEILRREFPARRPDANPRSFRRYLHDLRRHRFCVCPRGNGIDTHRVWECLYLKTIPILRRSLHTEYWRQCGLPLLLVDDWGEVTRERLEDEYPRVQGPAARFDQLRLSHYANLMERDVENDYFVLRTRPAAGP
jgi:hypothetical protein